MRWWCCLGSSGSGPQNVPTKQPSQGCGAVAEDVQHCGPWTDARGLSPADPYAWASTAHQRHMGSSWAVLSWDGAHVVKASEGCHLCSHATVAHASAQPQHTNSSRQGGALEHLLTGSYAADTVLHAVWNEGVWEGRVVMHPDALPASNSPHDPQPATARSTAPDRGLPQADSIQSTPRKGARMSQNRLRPTDFSATQELRTVYSDLQHRGSVFTDFGASDSATPPAVPHLSGAMHQGLTGFMTDALGPQPSTVVAARMSNMTQSSQPEAFIQQSMAQINWGSPQHSIQYSPQRGSALPQHLRGNSTFDSLMHYAGSGELSAKHVNAGRTHSHNVLLQSPLAGAAASTPFAPAGAGPGNSVSHTRLGRAQPDVSAPLMPLSGGTAREASAMQLNVSIHGDVHSNLAGTQLSNAPLTSALLMGTMGNTVPNPLSSGRSGKLPARVLQTSTLLDTTGTPRHTILSSSGTQGNSAPLITIQQQQQQQFVTNPGLGYLVTRHSIDMRPSLDYRPNMDHRHSIELPPGVVGTGRNSIIQLSSVDMDGGLLGAGVTNPALRPSCSMMGAIQQPSRYRIGSLTERAPQLPFAVTLGDKREMDGSGGSEGAAHSAQVFGLMNQFTSAEGRSVPVDSSLLQVCSDSANPPFQPMPTMDEGPAHQNEGGSGREVVEACDGLRTADGSSDAPPPPVVMDVVIEATTDPTTNQRVLLCSMQDVTARAEAESMLLALTEGQLSMICQMFPRHIIEALAQNVQANRVSGEPPEPRERRSSEEACAEPSSQPHCALSPGVPNARLRQLARSHDGVTILFMDIVGFTSMSKSVGARQVMGYINELFSLLDDLVQLHGVHKVETAGDCYIVSAGIVEQGPDGFMHVLQSHDPADSALRVMDFAKDMLAAARTVHMPHTNEPSRIRIGLHSGSCTTGLVGSRLPKFSVFGDTMNTASRMESTAPPGRIQVSEAIHALLPEEAWEATGGVEVKGKGRMETYLWLECAGADEPPSFQEVIMAGRTHRRRSQLTALFSTNTRSSRPRPTSNNAHPGRANKSEADAPDVLLLSPVTANANLRRSFVEAGLPGVCQQLLGQWEPGSADSHGAVPPSPGTMLSHGDQPPSLLGVTREGARSLRNGSSEPGMVEGANALLSSTPNGTRDSLHNIAMLCSLLCTQQHLNPPTHNSSLSRGLSASQMDMPQPQGTSTQNTLTRTSTNTGWPREPTSESSQLDTDGARGAALHKPSSVRADAAAAAGPAISLQVPVLHLRMARRPSIETGTQSASSNVRFRLATSPQEHPEHTHGTSAAAGLDAASTPGSDAGISPTMVSMNMFKNRMARVRARGAQVRFQSSGANVFDVADGVRPQAHHGTSPNGRRGDAAQDL